MHVNNMYLYIYQYLFIYTHRKVKKRWTIYPEKTLTYLTKHRFLGWMYHSQQLFPLDTYKVGPEPDVIHGSMYNPYKWPKINGFALGLFHPKKWSYGPLLITDRGPPWGMLSRNKSTVIEPQVGWPNGFFGSWAKLEGRNFSKESPTEGPIERTPYKPWSIY